MKKITYYPGHSFIEGIISDALNYDHIVIDAFCGMGGFTEGFENTGHYKVISCINHWDVAIETHMRNHPNCLHIEEDFRTADLTLVKYMVDEILRRAALIGKRIQKHGSFGLECTNFSNAKGGMARNADSRTLADHMDRYVMLFDFDNIWIENVREFLLWGDMIPKVVWELSIKGKLKKKTIHFNPDIEEHSIFETMKGAYCPLHIEKENNKITSLGRWMIPDPAKKSVDFKKWRKYIHSFGYHSEHKILNAADFGVPQHRKRLIIQFVRNDVPIYWPTPTHHKTGANGLLPWNAIGPCLDLEDIGTELLSFIITKTGKNKGKLRPRIKSPKTIKRLMKGCLRHGIRNGKQVFITKYMGNNADTGINNGKSIHEASNTVATSNRVGLVNTRLIDYYFGNGYTIPETAAAGVSGTKDGASLHTIQFVDEHRNNGGTLPIENASFGIQTKDKYSLDSVTIIDQQYSQSIAKPINEASGSLINNPKEAVVNINNVKFVDLRYSNGQQNSGIAEQSPAVTSVPKQVIMNVDQYIMDTQFNNEASGIKSASKTLTASRKHFYVINSAWFDGHSKPISEPSATLIARQDKMPQYLIVTETGELAIEVFPHDPPHYVAFKRFMADYGIVRVTMRMIYDTEMLKIQSFDPKKNKLTKSATDNKKMIGNAVPPLLVEALGNAHHKGWVQYKAKKAA